MVLLEFCWEYLYKYKRFFIRCLVEKVNAIRYILCDVLKNGRKQPKRGEKQAK